MHLSERERQTICCLDEYLLLISDDNPARRLLSDVLDKAQYINHAQHSFKCNKLVLTKFSGSTIVSSPLFASVDFFWVSTHCFQSDSRHYLPARRIYIQGILRIACVMQY